MIAFYGWGTSQIVNMMIAKVSLFKTEPADLYILDTMRISREFITAVRKTHIFNEVLVIPAAKQYFLPLRHLSHSSFLCRAINTASHFTTYIPNCMLESSNFRKNLEKNSCSKSYSRVITSLLWGGHLAGGMQFFHYFNKKNSQTKFGFIDEAPTDMLRYNLDWFCNAFPDYSNIFERCFFDIAWFLYHHCSVKKLEQKYKSKIDSYYVFETLSENPDYAAHNMAKKILPPVTKDTPEMLMFMQNLESDFDYSQYNIRSVYLLYREEVISGNIANKPFLNDLKVITSVVPEADILFKAHPQFPISLEEYQGMIGEMFVDNRKLQLDSLFSSVNLSDKILITRRSTSVSNPKFLFNKEPYVIYTYELYSDVMSDIDIQRCRQMYFELRGVYTDKTRVCAPNNISEFNRILHSIMTKINDGTAKP